MEYVRCECEACKQMIVLPGEVLVSECRCPGCGKPVAIPEHESTPFVHRMRARVLAALAIAGIFWLAWAIVSAFMDAPKRSRRAAPEPPAHASPLPIQAAVEPIQVEGNDKPAKAIPREFENATANAEPEPNAG